jgi:hypothetical protein
VAGLHLAQLDELCNADKLHSNRFSIDGASVPSPGGLAHRPKPHGPGKLGSKRHLVTDGQGIPMVFCVTGANRHDSVVCDELVDALPAIAGKPLLSLACCVICLGCSDRFTYTQTNDRFVLFSVLAVEASSKRYLAA